MHTSVSGAGDYRAATQEPVFSLAREIVGQWRRTPKTLIEAAAFEEPYYDPKKLYGIIPKDRNTQFDMREVLARCGLQGRAALGSGASGRLLPRFLNRPDIRGRHLGPVGLDRFQGGDGSQPGQTVACQLLILRRSAGFPRNFLLRDLADHLCRRSDHHRARRDHRFDPHKRLCADDRFRTQLNAVHDHGIHPDQSVSSDNAPMQDRTVADMTVGFDHRVTAREGMDNAIVLNIGPVANHDPAEIAPQARAGSNIAPLTEYDISDQNRLRVNECSIGNNGNESLEFIEIGHSVSSFHRLDVS